MGNLCFQFSLIMFFMLCLVVCPSLCQSNFTLDGLALLAFKSSVRDPYNHLKNWSNSSSFCSWFGVTCDSKSERVTILSLSEMGLEGTLPSQIGNLSFLINLELQSNNFHGKLPKELLHLHKLEKLNLSYNNFSGEILTWIGSLFMLKHLSLANNTFGGIIPPSIFNMSKLETLDLMSNSINGPIPFDIGRLQHLKFLRISRNILSGNIPPTISNLSSLEHISLSLNFLEGHIPKEMNKLTKLKNMFMGMNKLSGQVPSIGNLIMLENLYLASNNLQGDIPNEISNLTNLNSIDLSGNQLSGHIPRGIGKFTWLQELFLDNNNFEGNISNEIISLANLEIMSLSVNQLSGPIPRGIESLTMLQQLYLDSNNLEGMPRRISYFEILDATQRFDETNLLGRGSFGSVFKGKLSSGMIVAVKIFNFDSEALSRSFEVECDVVRNLRHRNLVKIISSCSNVDFKCLIMEFIPNGSLEKWLYSDNYHLDFLQRLNIMINVAFALEYLHQDLSIPIVHCDLKPSNILLDDNMVAHVSDFGIAKFLDRGKSKTHTETISTIGYIAPEYGFAGIVSTKADVYSYGIILMEVFTRKKPTEDMFINGLSLKTWISKSMPDALIQVMDSSLLQANEQHVGSILTTTSAVFELALNCCSDFPTERCNMSDIVASLNKIKDLYYAKKSNLNKY
ncbi:receptor kinase-like protein Xa21 isoform X2 [Prosopis cineraria]|uniref:receptor kinase-like protein Xa21 isoform X2 n=1 Tax=Prosopis cineraria TaxID=364024 RepID=UPI00240F00A7|nr:receptor kinase-like protein Xa21 isoform X2 [Prosopis cineraria]